MKELIKRLLKEYVDDYIQNVDFDGFSEPILIPQFNKYIVKFNGTGKVDKIPDSEKMVFKDKGGKEYVFDSNDVQKSGNSPFYISLDVLRRHYDVRFKDDFVRHKQKLSDNEYNKKLKELIPLYSHDGRCKNIKCSQLRDVIESSLKEIYRDDYGVYNTDGCEPTEGFLNSYPIPGTKDKNNNSWSKLNYVIFQPNAMKTLIIAYLKKYGTFEHNDFIEWVNEDKERLFKGDFLNLMLRNITIPKPQTTGNSMKQIIQNIFPNSNIVDSFCPSNRRQYNESFVVSHNGKNIIFQPVVTKNSRTIYHDGKYYLLFGRRHPSPMLNRRADYIITNSGVIFHNSNVLDGISAWEFENPPIRGEVLSSTDMKKIPKIR